MKGTIWCLHGAVGMAEDWRGFEVPGWAVRRVDLWRFLDCCPMEMEAFGEALNEEMRQAGEGKQVLLGYSMGGRLGLHALLAAGEAGGGPSAVGQRRRGWDGAVVVSAHPGLVTEEERVARRAADAEWAAKALEGDWGEFLAEWEGQGVLKAGAGGDRDHDRDGQATGRGGGGMRMADRGGLVGRRRSVARSLMDWSLGRQGDLRGKLAAVGCPVLWAVGERDGKFRSLGEEVVARCEGVPSAECQVRSGSAERGALRRVAAATVWSGPGRPPVEMWVAEGAGHRLPWEVPEAFGEKVGEWLEDRVS